MWAISLPCRQRRIKKTKFTIKIIQYQKYFEQNDFPLLIFPYAMELEGDFVFRASNFEFSNLRDGANSAAFKRIDCDAKVLVEWG